MATAPLSIAHHTVCGIWVSQQRGTLSSLSVHPASPVLLTSNSPQRTHDSNDGVVIATNAHMLLSKPKQRGHTVPLRSLLLERGERTPQLPAYIALPGTTPSVFNSQGGPSNPEGNFKGNQLLGGSMSLSPLYPALTNDLDVSIVTGFHHSFPWLYHGRA